MFAVATTRVTTVSRQRATVLIYSHLWPISAHREGLDRRVLRRHCWALQSKEVIGENPNHKIFVAVFKITDANFKNLN